MNTQSFTIIFSVLLSVIFANSSSVCNNKILQGQRKEILSDQKVDIINITEGTNGPFPQFNSNKVFKYSISHPSDNHITYTFDEDYTITAIGIRQLFHEENLKEICPDSLKSDLESIYNISYKVSSYDDFQFLEYPIGTTGMGRFNPWVTLPYQKIPVGSVTKETLKIAIKPTTVRTIKIQKETEYLDGIISNGGTYCLQFELYGCKVGYDSEQRSIVLEYQMPEPIDNSDQGYTGLCSENSCTGGVGKLVDESISGKLGTVFWDTNGPEIVTGNMFENTSYSLLKLLFLFDDVHYIERVNIFTFKGEENAVPLFITVNGIIFETWREIDSFSYVTLSPWINTNSVLLEFHFNASKNLPRIGIGEVNFVEYRQESDSPQSVIIQVVSLATLSVLLFILLGVSVTANFIQIISKNRKKRVLPQIPNANHCNKRTEDETSTYEAIPGERNRYATVYTEPDAQPPNKSYNPNVSVLEMATNPTYVTVLPSKPDEHLPGYSHLDFSKQTEDTSEEKNEVPVIKEQPKKVFLTDAQKRRSSYFEQHMLSDPK